MGPIALFDKSFLQSLSQDESVWFDQFFLANVCPVFYLETQADLAKANCGSLTPDEYVTRISDKFPDYSGAPNVHHATMVTANLLGEDVPMRPQVILPRGCHKSVAGHSIAIAPESREAKAFLRWSQGKFEDDERQAAAAWRAASFGIDTADVISQLQTFSAYQEAPCPTLADVKVAAHAMLDRLSPRQQLTLSFGLLGAFSEQLEAVLGRFLTAGEPPLLEYAPYAHFALEVELFYHLAVHKGRMSVAQRMDMVYLFYLPFCDFFVSYDWVHRDCAPLFIRADQDFIPGAELKDALSAINAAMASLSDKEKMKSIHELAPRPPSHGDNLVTKLWDRHHPKWRRAGDSVRPSPPPEWLTELGPLVPSEHADPTPFPATGPPEAIMRIRAVRKKKGSWWLVPEELRRSSIEPGADAQGD